MLTNQDYVPAKKSHRQLAMRILVADDHAIYRAGLTPLLDQLGDDVEVREAGSFDEAVDLLAKDSGYDLIVLDLLMPSMGRFEGLEAVRRAAPDVPLIVVSMIEARRDVLRAVELGAMGYIPKTASGTDILKAVRRVLDGEIWIPKALLEGEDESPPLPIQEPALTYDELPENDPRARLTGRQRQVLSMLAEGMPNAEIADRLSLSENTVKLYVSAVLKALNVSNRTEAALLAANLEKNVRRH